MDKPKFTCECGRKFDSDEGFAECLECRIYNDIISSALDMSQLEDWVKPKQWTPEDDVPPETEKHDEFNDDSK